MQSYWKQAANWFQTRLDGFVPMALSNPRKLAKISAKELLLEKTDFLRRTIKAQRAISNAAFTQLIDFTEEMGTLSVKIKSYKDSMGALQRLAHPGEPVFSVQNDKKDDLIEAVSAVALDMEEIRYLIIDMQKRTFLSRKITGYTSYSGLYQTEYIPQTEDYGFVQQDRSVALALRLIKKPVPELQA